MMKTQEREFQTAHGPLTFTVQQLNAVRAGKLLIKLGKIAGPALAQIAEGDGDLSGLGDAVQTLFSKLDENSFMELSNELLAGVTVQVNGEFASMAGQAAVDQMFTGHVVEWFKLLAFSLQVNYGDFSVALDAMKKQFPTMKVTPGTKAPGASGTITSSGLRNG